MFLLGKVRGVQKITRGFSRSLTQIFSYRQQVRAQYKKKVHLWGKDRWIRLTLVVTLGNTTGEHRKTFTTLDNLAFSCDRKKQNTQ